MIFLNYFQFHQNDILELSFSNGITNFIKLTSDSGRIVTRKKIGISFNINHPGIYVGVDYYTGEPYILHNHYKVFGTAGVSSLNEYGLNEKITWDDRICINNKMKVLQKGLEQAIYRKPYHWLINNCQITVNKACNNKETSEDVKKWGGRIVMGVVALLLVGGATR